MTTPETTPCHCGRCVLDRAADGEVIPCVEETSTVDRIRHTPDACEEYRTMERRAPPDGVWRPSQPGRDEGR